MTTTQAYTEGRAAGNARRSIFTCPYAGQPELMDAWFAGYNGARPIAW